MKAARPGGKPAPALWTLSARVMSALHKDTHSMVWNNEEWMCECGSWLLFYFSGSELSWEVEGSATHLGTPYHLDTHDAETAFLL